MNGHGKLLRVAPLHDHEHPVGSGAALAVFESGAVLLGYYSPDWRAMATMVWNPDAGPDTATACTLLGPWPHDRCPNDGDVVDAFLAARDSGQLDTAVLLLLPPHEAEG